MSVPNEHVYELYQSLNIYNDIKIWNTQLHGIYEVLRKQLAFQL